MPFFSFFCYFSKKKGCGGGDAVWFLSLWLDT